MTMIWWIFIANLGCDETNEWTIPSGVWRLEASLWMQIWAEKTVVDEPGNPICSCVLCGVNAAKERS